MKFKSKLPLMSVAQWLDSGHRIPLFIGLRTEGCEMTSDIRRLCGDVIPTAPHGDQNTVVLGVEVCGLRFVPLLKEEEGQGC